MGGPLTLLTHGVLFDYEFVCGLLLCVYHWEISTRDSIFFLKNHEESRNEIMNYLFKRTIVMEFLMTKIDVFRKFMCSF